MVTKNAAGNVNDLGFSLAGNLGNGNENFTMNFLSTINGIAWILSLGMTMKMSIPSFFPWFPEIFAIGIKKDHFHELFST